MKMVRYGKRMHEYTTVEYQVAGNDLAIFFASVLAIVRRVVVLNLALDAFQSFRAQIAKGSMTEDVALFVAFDRNVRSSARSYLRRSER